MSSESPGIRLGDLLTNAGLLRVEALREAMQTAKQQQLPVGRVLITSGYLNELQLKGAVQAQSLLKDGLIQMQPALKALRLLAREQLTLDEALARVGWKPKGGTVTNKLGEILIESQVISANDLQNALEQCTDLGLPLGRMLVLIKAMPESMLSNALNAQVLLRDKKITRDQVVHGLKAAKQRQVPIEYALAESGVLHLPSPNSMRLGELLIEAELIDQDKLMNAIELGLVQEKLLGQVLLELGQLNEQDLNAALQLQKMLANGSVSRVDAVQALKTCHKDKVDVERALKNQQSLAEDAGHKPELSMEQFLKLSSIVQSAELERAIRHCVQDSDFLGKMLLFAGVLPEQMVEACLDAYALLSDNTLSMDQAMVALRYCQSHKIDLETSFKRLGWAPDEDEVDAADFEDSAADEVQAPVAAADVWGAPPDFASTPSSAADTTTAPPPALPEPVAPPTPAQESRRGRQWAGSAAAVNATANPPNLAANLSANLSANSSTDAGAASSLEHPGWAAPPPAPSSAAPESAPDIVPDATAKTENEILATLFAPNEASGPEDANQAPPTPAAQSIPIAPQSEPHSTGPSEPTHTDSRLQPAPFPITPTIPDPQPIAAAPLRNSLAGNAEERIPAQPDHGRTSDEAPVEPASQTTEVAASPWAEPSPVSANAEVKAEDGGFSWAPPAPEEAPKKSSLNAAFSSMSAQARKQSAIDNLAKLAEAANASVPQGELPVLSPQLPDLDPDSPESTQRLKPLPVTNLDSHVPTTTFSAPTANSSPSLDSYAWGAPPPAPVPMPEPNREPVFTNVSRAQQAPPLAVNQMQVNAPSISGGSDVPQPHSIPQPAISSVPAHQYQVPQPQPQYQAPQLSESSPAPQQPASFSAPQQPTPSAAPQPWGPPPQDVPSPTPQPFAAPPGFAETPAPKIEPVKSTGPVTLPGMAAPQPVPAQSERTWGWGQTPPPQPMGLTSGATNPGWAPPPGVTEGQQAQSQSQPQPPAPQPVPTATDPSADSGGWEYGGGEPAQDSTAGRKGLNAFMPKRKDK